MNTFECGVKHHTPWSIMYSIRPYAYMPGTSNTESVHKQLFTAHKCSNSGGGLHCVNCKIQHLIQVLDLLHRAHHACSTRSKHLLYLHVKRHRSQHHGHSPRRTAPHTQATYYRYVRCRYAHSTLTADVHICVCTLQCLFTSIRTTYSYFMGDCTHILCVSTSDLHKTNTFHSLLKA